MSAKDSRKPALRVRIPYFLPFNTGLDCLFHLKLFA